MEKNKNYSGLGKGLERRVDPDRRGRQPGGSFDANFFMRLSSQLGGVPVSTEKKGNDFRGKTDLSLIQKSELGGNRAPGED